MNDLSPATLAQAPVAPASAILTAADTLLPLLERGQRVDSATLRSAMETAFGASDASGLWDWKAGYEACEAATVLFLRKYGRAIFRQADKPAGFAGHCRGNHNDVMPLCFPAGDPFGNVFDPVR